MSNKPSYKVAVLFWIIYTTLVQMAFDCNLRANLIKVDYEEAIDSDFELLNRGKLLYFPRNTAQWHFFMNSPLRHQQRLEELTIERDANSKNTLLDLVSCLLVENKFLHKQLEAM